MSFTACPQTFNKDTIAVPDNVVAIAPSVLGCKDTAYVESTATPAFLFVIDNSGSMKGNNGSDPTGARFTVTKALLDTLYARQPKTKVGLVVFQELLFFNAASPNLWYTQFFKTMPTVYDSQPNQAYMPLVTLDSMYNGYRGIDILDSILVTTGTGGNTDLRYQPNYTPALAGRTNINIAFLAARDAFANVLTPKNQQYIIFLSDGEANQGQRDPGQDSIWYWRDSTRNLPTTFTVFFSANGVPASEQTMTTNILNNGYSTSNVLSAYYSVTASFNSLMTVLINNVINQVAVPATPVSMIINNVTSSSYSNGAFVFPDSFMIGATVSQYTMMTTYQYTKPGSTTPIFTTDTTVFYVRQSASATAPPGITLDCTTYNNPVTSIPVTATFLDTNHDGKIDKIDITWTDTAAIKQTMPSIAQWIKTLNMTTLDGTKVNLQAATLVPDLSNKTIHVVLTQDTGASYETAWRTATFILTDTAMSLSGRPFSVANIVDGAAPVITAVCFVPASADTLRVTFSEPVTDSNMPGSKNAYFSIIKKGGAIIPDTAKPVLNQGQRLVYVYAPHVLNDSESVREGTRVFPLVLCGDVSIVTGYHVASNPFTPGKTVIPSSQQDPNHQITYGTRIEIDLIPAIKQAVSQGDVKAKVSIFDAVGNAIINNQEMSVDTKDPNNPKIFWNWDGRTGKGKFVGGGTYLARTTIEDNVNHKTIKSSQPIGVRQ